MSPTAGSTNGFVLASVLEGVVREFEADALRGPIAKKSRLQRLTQKRTCEHVRRRCVCCLWRWRLLGKSCVVQAVCLIEVVKHPLGALPWTCVTNYTQKQ